MTIREVNLIKVEMTDVNSLKEERCRHLLR